MTTTIKVLAVACWR